MLANGHSPFDTRIFVKQATSLAAAGYTVSIIVPHTRTETRDNIAILPVPPARGGFAKLLATPLRILRVALRQPAHAVFCIHDSDILVTGIALKLLGRTVLYDAHEDTPLQISYQHWIPRLVRKPYAWAYYLIEKLCGYWFNGIIVAEPVIAKYFPAHKTSLVRNFPLAKPFREATAAPYAERATRLSYVGTLSRVRGLFQMLDAAEAASRETTFEFVLGGQFTPQSLERMVLEKYKVTFLQWVNYEKLVALFVDSKIGIIIPNPIERYKTNYPVKLFEYMAAALPVIASREGESAAFVKEAGCGILVDPLNLQEISAAIVWLFQHPAEAEAMGKRGQALIFGKYNWENESRVLLDVFNRL